MLVDPSNTSTVPLANISAWILSPLTHSTGALLIGWSSLMFTSKHTFTRSLQTHPTLVHPPRHHHKPSPCLIPLRRPGSSYVTWYSLKFATKRGTHPPLTPTHAPGLEKMQLPLPPPADTPARRPCDLLSTPAAGAMDMQTLPPLVSLQLLHLNSLTVSPGAV